MMRMLCSPGVLQAFLQKYSAYFHIGRRESKNKSRSAGDHGRSRWRRRFGLDALSRESENSPIGVNDLVRPRAGKGYAGIVEADVNLDAWVPDTTDGHAKALEQQATAAVQRIGQGQIKARSDVAAQVEAELRPGMERFRPNVLRKGARGPVGSLRPRFRPPGPTLRLSKIPPPET